MKKTLYVFKVDLDSNSPKFSQKSIEVNETEKTYRIEKASLNKNRVLTGYRSVVNKSELNKVYKMYSNSKIYEMLSDKNDLCFFKKAVLSDVERQKNKLQEEINSLYKMEHFVLSMHEVPPFGLQVTDDLTTERQDS